MLILTLRIKSTKSIPLTPEIGGPSHLFAMKSCKSLVSEVLRTSRRFRCLDQEAEQLLESGHLFLIGPEGHYVLKVVQLIQVSSLRVSEWCRRFKGGYSIVRRVETRTLKHTLKSIQRFSVLETLCYP